MQISDQIERKLINMAGSVKTVKARKLVLDNRVGISSTRYTNESNFKIEAIIDANNSIYNTNITVSGNEIELKKCNCPDYVGGNSICSHILASVFYLEEYIGINPMDESEMIILGSKEAKEKEAELIAKQKKEEYETGLSLINEFYKSVVDVDDNRADLDEKNQGLQEKFPKGSVDIIPKIKFDGYSSTMKLSFKIGVKTKYSIKKIDEFVRAMDVGQVYSHGAKLEFKHCEDMFTKRANKLLPFILKYGRAIAYAKTIENESSYYSYYSIKASHIIIDSKNIDEFFDIYEDNEIEANINKQNIKMPIDREKIDSSIQIVKKKDNEYMLTCQTTDMNIIRGEKNSYLICDNKKINIQNKKDFEPVFMLLSRLSNYKYHDKCIYDQESIKRVFSVIYPKTKEYFDEESVKKFELESYLPKELGVKAYLDLDEAQNIQMDVKFCYDDFEFNPLETNTTTDFVRNMEQEHGATSLILRSGFETNKKDKKYHLANEEDIYSFLTDDMETFMSKFEVLVTDRFKSKQVRQPRIGTLGVKVESDLLNLDFSGLDVDKEELKDILQKYNVKKRYHRLKDGTFINLDKNEDIELIKDMADGLDIPYKDMGKGQVRIPMYRTMYLEKLLDANKGIKIKKDEAYKQIVDRFDNNTDLDISCPKHLEDILRYYQLNGFKWLKTLDEYKFGGILADDMGLGKTLQIITLLHSYMEETKPKKRKTSIVVCPSSLSLNWKNEIEKFSSDIKTLVIKGTAGVRKELIKEIENYDLVITSYDLLKRDIDEYLESKYKFKYIIADEAQYIKNSNTQNAKAIKCVNAETRYALTGTPIENSISELWSIFDYVLPGYLYSYGKFKKDFETPIVKNNDEDKLRRVKMMIEPFILRRLKKDVLKELPDKTISILNNEMEGEQNKIYLSYLANAKKELKTELETNGFEKSQIKILALLNRLRQICCHPSLFLENYTGDSSKLEQCMELVEEATEGGHKILLFSQFTSMFEIIEKELGKKGIKYFKLTGKTKIDERIKLVDEFNESKDVQVFLISLKAGGTGLNLTGADMVVHFDPWWNLSAENQATDRAYRIGQKSNVQVFKLITKNSIEEKIHEIQQKKAELVDNMLTTEEVFLNKLSKDDIMKLFD